MPAAKAQATDMSKRTRIARNGGRRMAAREAAPSVLERAADPAALSVEPCPGPGLGRGAVTTRPGPRD
eukprot:8966408-Heterocapsa_arctica.AAC.1